MNLHEYQAKQILKEFGLLIPEFAVFSDLEEVKGCVSTLGTEEVVLKIQVHAGGRGKAGGVQFAKGIDQILKKSAELLGMKMVNEQTGPSGVVANQVMISKPAQIAKEFYLSALIDRDRGVPLLIASREGGMEIEKIAEESPEKILKVPFGFDGTVRSYQYLQLAKFMHWDAQVAKEGQKLIQGLARCFIEKDCSLLEINPLVLTKENKLLALDAKMSIDDNALFRHPELLACYDPSQISNSEQSAKEHDLAYIAMQGNIGCMVNGAGLAMATMDIIQLYGGSPANFLDVGGGASKEKVAKGFQIILQDPRVKAVLVNIFGGIMNCATLAEGVLMACETQKIKVPLVVRMEGTNVEEGRRLLKASKLKIETAADLNEAAQKAVKVAS